MRFIPLFSAFDSKTKIKLLLFLLDSNYSPAGERELSRLVGVSHASVHRIVRELGELDIVYSKRAGNVVLWHVNSGGLAYRQLKKGFAEFTGDREPFTHLVGALRAELAKHNAIKAVLFGSVARRSERASSDVDVFVLVENKSDKARVSKALERRGGEFLRIYGNALNHYVLTRAEYAHPANPALAEEIGKGMVIYQSRKGGDGRG
ncbi:hypothetical protein AUJ14_00375 [Candidatus Micrarchaeota archaeon CG1_02_55_22]|nr:MAG: hypothetical protein AUJ14_00375 [Candidatus Micrarchaeota archaeon CG1_02_55_22]